MLDLAMELAKAVQQRCRDNGDEREIRDCLSYIIQEERDLYPAAGELDATLAELIDDEAECLYMLCHIETRQPLNNVPECFFGSEPGDDEELSTRGLCWIQSAIVRKEAADEVAAMQAEIAAERAANRRYISDEERDAVYSYAKANGKQWKRQLRKAWEAGTGGVLQALAAHKNFGGQWLSDFKLPKHFHNQT